MNSWTSAWFWRLSHIFWSGFNFIVTKMTRGVWLWPTDYILLITVLVRKWEFSLGGIPVPSYSTLPTHSPGEPPCLSIAGSQQAAYNSCSIMPNKERKVLTENSGKCYLSWRGPLQIDYWSISAGSARPWACQPSSFRLLWLFNYQPYSTLPECASPNPNWKFNIDYNQLYALLLCGSLIASIPTALRETSPR